MTRARRRRPKTAFLVFAAASLAVAVATLFPVAAVYDVSASTERLTYTVSPALPTVNLPGGFVTLDRSTARIPFRGAIRFTPGAQVTLTRVGTGPLVIEGKLDSPGKNVAVLVDTLDHTLPEAPVSYIYAEVAGLEALGDSGRNLVIPVSGAVEIAREIGDETQPTVPLLRSGTVKLIGQTLFDPTRVFEAASAELNLGDAFKLENPETTTEGVVVVDVDAGMSVSVRCKARRAWIIRPGGGRERLYIPLQTRIARDPVVQGIWVVFLFLLGFWKLFSKPDEETK